MQTLLTLTDAAILHIKEWLNKTPGAVGFRLTLKKTGCSGLEYVPKIITQIPTDDIHFMAPMELPIYVDPVWQDHLSGTLVDYQYVATNTNTLNLKQKRLIFTNPHEKNRCGCGESFTVE